MLSSENKRFYSSSLPIHEPPLGTGLMIRDLSASSQCSQEDKYGCSRFSSRHSSAHYSLMCEKDLKSYIGQRWREAWEYCEQCYGRDGLRVGIYCMSGKAWPGLVGLLILNSDISSFFLLFEPVWRDMCRLFTRIVGEENTVLDSPDRKWVWKVGLERLCVWLTRFSHRLNHVLNPQQPSSTHLGKSSRAHKDLSHTSQPSTDNRYLLVLDGLGHEWNKTAHPPPFVREIKRLLGCEKKHAAAHGSFKALLSSF